MLGLLRSRCHVAVTVLVLAHLGWGLGRALFRTLPRTRAEIASYRDNPDALADRMKAEVEIFF